MNHILKVAFLMATERVKGKKMGNMKLFEINEEFEGTFDQALATGAFHFVKDLTEEEELNISLFGCENEMQFIMN